MKNRGRTEDLSCHSRIREPDNVRHVEDQRENCGRYGIQVQLDHGDDQKPNPEHWECV